MIQISVEVARDLIDRVQYDAQTGAFVSIAKGQGARPYGYKLGYTNKAGYIIIQIRRKNYAAHRLAWFLTFGYWPVELDHINGVKNDNRICNLRECDRPQNIANAKIRKDSLQPFRGVQARGIRFLAQIQVRGQRKHLGSFATAEEASKAYAEAGKAGFGEFHRC